MPQSDEHAVSLFPSLVAMLAQSALLGMGKMIHPATGKAEIDLEGSQIYIDLLETLSEKTRGNLTPEEDHMLKEALTALRLNFVDTVQTLQKSMDQATPGGETGQTGPAAASEPTPAAQAPAPEATPAAPATPKNEENVRYKKSYGA